MVIAAFLNTHLLEPRKQRLRAEGFNEGYALGYSEGYALGYSKGLGGVRAATLAEVRSLLQEQGFNLNEIALPDAGDTDPPIRNAPECNSNGRKHYA